MLTMTTTDYSVLGVRLMPLSGAMNGRRPAVDDIVGGLVSMPPRMPTFYLGTVLPG